VKSELLRILRIFCFCGASEFATLILVNASEEEVRSPSANHGSPGLTSVNFITIGVYGWDEAGFFGALQQAGVDTFCDIRWRRGVRGREYAFANSARLQRRLAALAIRYVHVRELAPKPMLRQLQAQADQAQGVAKRQRTTLGQVFIESYRKENLARFDSRKFIEQLGAEARTVALFCVEREPAACHRSLLAERLREELGLEIRHWLPPSTVP
jgi:hypothetical protein